jgi:hypothetical protein
MERSRIFISYSHKDCDWLERLTEQLAVLHRRGLVDIWSDELIAVGDVWQEAIEKALTEAKMAVLLVSPSFLASEFIWTKEMPRIEAHAAKGMEALPLIVRPCAWQLEGFLASLQARPREGRALSLGNESQIDLDLSAFVTELADKIGHNRSVAARPIQASVQSPGRRPERYFDALGEWDGHYGNGLLIHLHVEQQSPTSFSGTLAYPDGTVTNIEGMISYHEPGDDVLWRQIGGRAANPDQIAVTFNEVGYKLLKDGGEVDLRGEYRAYASLTAMHGAWVSNQRLVDWFALRRDRH